jgi:hypothetical protein
VEIRSEIAVDDLPTVIVLVAALVHLAGAKI